MSNLDRLTAEDLMAAIGTSEETDDNLDVDLSELKSGLLKELNRRIGDPDLVKEIPGTGLIQLVKELLKQPDKEKPAEAEGLNILDSLDAVPKDHAVKVLDREIARLEGELARFREKREEIG